MHGVLNLLKPPGMTSHDAVAFVRRVAGHKRVGHTGTLDPAAAGVLPVCLGQATRLVEYLQDGTKEYIAELTFGQETDTLDAVGTVVREAPAGHITLESLRAALDQFRGVITQTPPLYSAIKQDGKKLYELARAGVNVEDAEIKTRQVEINSLVVTRFIEGERPRAILRIECGGGTYIRSLVRDIGRALDSAATMTFLVRTRNGSFSINDAVAIEHIAMDWQSALLPMTAVLEWCASLIVTNDEATQQLSQGRIFTASNAGCLMSKETTASERRMLFLNRAHTTAVLAARELPLDAKTYKPEKVFFLDRDN